jgi:hypothetical protein
MRDEERDERNKISWLSRILLKLWPGLVMYFFAKKMGIKNVVFDRLHDIFSGVGRIDIFPTNSGSRGFIFVIDGKTALYFYQDGDHFAYDGFEMGEYEKGDITIFDRPAQ